MATGLEEIRDELETVARAAVESGRRPDDDRSPALTCVQCSSPVVNTKTSDGWLCHDCLETRPVPTPQEICRSMIADLVRLGITGEAAKLLIDWCDTLGEPR